MATIAFHNLAGNAIAPALGALLEGMLEAGERAVLLAGSQERLDALSTALWTYHPASFLPHGSAADGRPEQQPIWLTTTDENPNGATVLVLVEGSVGATLERFARTVYLFDRSDAPAREVARERWRQWREAGHALSYWEYGMQGWRPQQA